MKVILANPRGFCAGVDRAIEMVERALELHGAPIYVRHEVVHNKFVVNELKSKGAIFVEEIDEVPRGKWLFLVHTVCHKPCANKRKTLVLLFMTPLALWLRKCTKR